jgi:hypothetical protein
MTMTKLQANRQAREASIQHLEVSFESGGVSCAATVYRPDSATGPLGCVVMGNGITLTRNDGIPASDSLTPFVAWGSTGVAPHRLRP